MRSAHTPQREEHAPVKMGIAVTERLAKVRFNELHTDPPKKPVKMTHPTSRGIFQTANDPATLEWLMISTNKSG